MKQRIGVIVGSVCLAVAVGGCARTEDPSRAGLGSSILNLLDGTYEDRAAERRAIRDDVLAEVEALAARAEELDREREQLVLTEATAAQRQANLDAQIALQQARLAQLDRAQDVDRAQLAALTTQIGDLDQQRTALQSAPSSPASDAELAQLQADVDELRAVVDTMITELATVE
ncbi:MAG: hypothetical protein KDA64_05440 [Rhodospirillaceae bacterium]|nr:hypothetical protein [Rhodospirillaceae bacterium]